MAPRVKKTEDAPKPKAPGKGEKSLLTMELQRSAAARGSNAPSSLDDIRAHLQDRLSSLNKAAESGLTEEMDKCIGSGLAGVVAKAKDHHVYVNHELKNSMDLQDQVKAEHERAMCDARSMAADAVQAMERDSKSNDSVKRTKLAAHEEMKALQRKYM